MEVGLGVARSQNLELHRLLDEGRRLQSAQLPPVDKGRMDDESAALEALRTRLAELQKDAAQAREPRLIQASDWAFAGNETPGAAIESVLWAASRGDVDRLAGLLGFSPDVRAQADAMYSRLPSASQQEYGSAERVVATLLAGSFPKDASAMTLLADKQYDQDAAISMSVEHSEGQSKTNIFRFHRAPGGWQLLVPSSVMSDYEKTLMGDPKLAEAGAP
jgi:hypothetical protein